MKLIEKGDHETMFITTLFTRKIGALTLMILLLFSVSPLQAATASKNRALWRVCAPQGSGFTVQMPGPAVREVKTTSIQYNYIEQTARGNNFYGIAYEDFAVLPLDVEGTLRAQCSDFAKGFQGQAVKWGTMTKNGLKGVVARIENRNSTAIVAAWMVNRRAYVIAFATPKTQIIPDEAKQFIDSLVIARY